MGSEKTPAVQTIEIPERAQMQIAAAVQRAEAAKNELNTAVAVLTAALKVPAGYVLDATPDGLRFVKVQEPPTVDAPSSADVQQPN